MIIKRMETKEVFTKYSNIAVYGMSKNPSKPSFTVPMFFYDMGYKIFPINPTTDEIEGIKVYHNLNDIPEMIDILNVFRPAEEALKIVEEAIQRKEMFGDIKLIWLQEGIFNDEAKALAEQNKLDFIQDKCMFVEYQYV